MLPLEEFKSAKLKQLKRAGLELSDFPSSEHRRALIFEKNASLIGKDPVFKKIFDSVIKGWNYLDKKQRKEVLDLIEGLIEKLKEYHDSYKNLKRASLRRAYFDDIQKYQDAVSNADTREKILHDSFIDSINILSRKMKALGLENSWRSDDEIYGLTPEATRVKPKLWMFKLFKEKI